MSYFSSISGLPRYRHVHVAFTWAGKVKTEELRQLFDQAAQWMRYAPSCWILYTDQSNSWWYEQIRHHMTKDDRVIICDVDVNDARGWHDQWVWDWLYKNR